MIGIRNIKLEHSGDFSGYYYLDVLNGFLPDGRYENGRLIGSRSRGVLLSCDSYSGFLLQDTKYDKQFNSVYKYLAKSKSFAEAIGINILNDATIEKARDYICKTNKPISGRTNFNCTVDNNVVTLEIDYQKNTVDMMPAKINENTISYTWKGIFTILDRVSGALRIITPDGDIFKIGSCSPQASGQFTLPEPAEDADWKTLNDRVTSLYRQGLYDQAVSIANEALSVAEKTFGIRHLNFATSLNSLASLYNTQGQYAQAEPLFLRALAIREKALGSDNPDVAFTLSLLASMHKNQGEYAKAEPLYQRALAIYEKALGPDHPDVAASLAGLAKIYQSLGQYAQAEPHYHRALAIGEKTFGPDNPGVAAILDDLAMLYNTQGQSTQAEALYKRALVIREKALGPDHPALATSLNNLALLYVTQGQTTEAEPLYHRSLAIYEKAGPNHPNVATSLNNLASLYDDQGQYAQAEPLYKRSLAIREKALGPNHPDVATSLNNLASLYYAQGQYARAEPLYKRALAISEKALGPDHPRVAASLNNLASLYKTQGQYEQALPLARKASAIYRQRIIAGGTSDAAIHEATKNRDGFFFHLELLSLNPGKEPSDKIADEAFQIVQLQQASGTASAIAKMAARFATGDDALASLVKRKQDASDRRGRAETQLVNAASKPPAERKADDEQRLRDDIARAVEAIAVIDAELTRSFPEYQELTRPEPASIRQVRALLKPGEAMLVYVLGDTSYLWVVKPDSAVFMPLKVKTQEVASQVASIRAALEFDRNGNAPQVSVQLLHTLYQGLFAPALPHLAVVRQVMVVPAGPLQSLPFGMLVAASAPEIRSDADYRKVDWLAKHYAFSVLPSVSSIQAFRQFVKPAGAQEPFAGFGDPVIGEAGGVTRGKLAKTDVATVFRGLKRINSAQQVSASSHAAARTPVMEIADVEAIRQSPRLPETADELRAMAKALKASPKAIWLQASANETQVKNLELSKYRTLAFATHGVMAGEIEGVGEPGLILTPPMQGSLDDDGYLSAGEIAKLKLNADWVVLSACNTAAADGTPGAEGLSGLSKAFFYAGARSLLVSHWPVASKATVALTTSMLTEYQANPAQGKAESLRKAMLALAASPGHPEYAHPIYWAPFVVVGEGGAGTMGKPFTAGRVW